jgi:hypothetical protein
MQISEETAIIIQHLRPLYCYVLISYLFPIQEACVSIYSPQVDKAGKCFQDFSVMETTTEQYHTGRSIASLLTHYLKVASLSLE